MPVRRLLVLVLGAAIAACSTPTDQVQKSGGGGGGANAAGIRVSVVLARVGLNQSFQLHVVARDSTGAVISSPTITYSSANTGTATVSTAGLIHGVALGATAVHVTVGNVTKMVPVVVATSPAGSLTGTLSGADSVASRPFTVNVSSGLLLTKVQPRFRPAIQF